MGSKAEEKTMSDKETRQPLPLELTEPFAPAEDENIEEAETDAKTQLSSNTTSTATSASVNASGVQVDVTADVAVDDVIA
jgi:hypothetical protein